VTVKEIVGIRHNIRNRCVTMSWERNALKGEENPEVIQTVAHHKTHARRNHTKASSTALALRPTRFPIGQLKFIGA
jgi:hypothetical protein